MDPTLPGKRAREEIYSLYTVEKIKFDKTIKKKICLVKDKRFKKRIWIPINCLSDDSMQLVNKCDGNVLPNIPNKSNISTKKNPRKIDPNPLVKVQENSKKLESQLLVAVQESPAYIPIIKHPIDPIFDKSKIVRPIVVDNRFIDQVVPALPISKKKPIVSKGPPIKDQVRDENSQNTDATKKDIIYENNPNKNTTKKDFFCENVPNADIQIKENIYKELVCRQVFITMKKIYKKGDFMLNKPCKIIGCHKSISGDLHYSILYKSEGLLYNTSTISHKNLLKACPVLLTNYLEKNNI